MKRLKLAFFIILLCLCIASLISSKQPSSEETIDHAAISGKSALVVDAKSGEILFQRAATTQRYPASTTKVLTALVTLESCDLDEWVTVGDEANRAQPDSSRAGLLFGEVLTIRDLLYAMLIASGNDAAYVLAVHVARHVTHDSRLSIDEAVEVFCGLMNERARSAGATNSHFSNPDGYHKYDHVSTAKDLTQITLAAMCYQPFRQIVGTKLYRLPGNRAQKYRILLNTNRLLDQESPYYFSKASGVKTGHTAQAGYCLISYASDNGRQVIAVVMESTETSVWKDSKYLLEWGLYH